MQLTNSYSFSATDIFGYNGFGLPSSETPGPDRDRAGGSSSIKESESVTPPHDRVSISESAKQKAHESAVEAQQPSESEENKGGDAEKQGASGEPLSKEQAQEVRELQKRDREVKTHEQAHLANAGGYARGGASYTYQAGPDGKRYAVGGEVPIDVSKERSPEKTIQKMQVVRRAALAPKNPSSADRSIAAQASRNLAEAQRELHTKDGQSQETESATKENASGKSDNEKDIPALPVNNRAAAINAYRQQAGKE